MAVEDGQLNQWDVVSKTMWRDKYLQIGFGRGGLRTKSPSL